MHKLAMFSVGEAGAGPGRNFDVAIAISNAEFGKAPGCEIFGP
jgi:hypothetical protein